jgi:hypothetical protein
MRLVNVSAWELTDQELDDLAADLEGTEPDYASELRHMKAWRRDQATLLLAGFAEKERRGPRGIGRPEIERRFAADWDLRGHWKDPAVSRRPDDPVYLYELRRR